MAPMLILSSNVGTGSILNDLLGMCEINFLTSSFVNKLKTVKMSIGSTHALFQHRAAHVNNTVTLVDSDLELISEELIEVLQKLFWQFPLGQWDIDISVK